MQVPESSRGDQLGQEKSKLLLMYFNATISLFLNNSDTFPVVKSHSEDI